MKPTLRADDFYYPARISSAQDRLTKGKAITENTIQWAREIGFIKASSASAEHIRAADCGPFATLCWPDAPPHYHQLISDAVCMVFALDDYFDRDLCLSGPESSQFGNQLQHGSFLSALTAFWQTGQLPISSNRIPILTACSNIRGRLSSYGVSDQWLARFALDFNDWIEGVRQEEAFRLKEEIPSPAALLSVRPHSGAVLLFMNFIEAALGLQLSDNARQSDNLKKIQQIAGRIAIYPNDVFSYRKESLHGHMMNLVTAFIHYNHTDVLEAIQQVADLHNIEMFDFDEIAKQILHNEDSEPDLRSYVIGLQHFLHGLFVWGWHADRYSREFFTGDMSRDTKTAAISHVRIRRIAAEVLNLKTVMQG